MKVTLIYPRIGDYADEACMEPLSLGALGGMTPPDVEVVLYDDRLERVPYDEPTDLVGITVQIFTARRAYEIAAEFRRRGVRVILGGMHATLASGEAAQHADSILSGDAESLWTKVVRDAGRGRLQRVYRAEPGAPQRDTLTRRELYAGKPYMPISLLQFSRGCPFECSFCATSAYFHKRHYHRCVEQVLREIENQPRRNLFFVDDNILGDFGAARMLFQELIPLRVRWVSQGSINMTQDEELMDLMARSGCLGHVIGFESLDPANLQSMRKAPNLRRGFSAYGPQLEVLREYGLQTWAAFTIGHDHDTRESILRTLDFAMRSKFAFAAFNVLLPYPGTPLYYRLQAEKRLLYDGRWWLHPDYRFNHAAFTPARMTADELTEVAFKARREFNSIGSIFGRMLDLQTHLRTPYRLGVYLAYNPLFRQETLKKQGVRLGLR